MTKGFEKLILPTELNEVRLKSVTPLDYEAWLIQKRKYKNYPLRPSEVNAPDYYDHLDLCKRRNREDPQKLQMSIWDIKTFGSILFMGFVGLQTNRDAKDFGTLDCTVIESFRHLGYATTALRALIKFGREYLDIDTYKGVVTNSNHAGQGLAEKLGFELEGEMYRRKTYILPPSTELEPSTPSLATRLVTSEGQV